MQDTNTQKTLVLKYAAALALTAAAGTALGGDIQMLAPLGGSDSVARDINDLGQVVGYSTLAGDTAIEATIWNSGTASGLGLATGADHSYANAINNNGQVAGYSEFGATPGDIFNSRSATFWGGSGAVDIGASMSFIHSIAYDINDAGVVALEGGRPGDTGGYAWNEMFGGMAAGADPLYDLSGNYGINNNNDMVGYAAAGFDGTQAIHTTFNGGGWNLGLEIGPQAVIDNARANAISDNGLIVGDAGDGGEHFLEAAIFTLDRSDPVEWLGKLDGFDASTANNVNESGLIVGSSTIFLPTGGQETRAVAWANNQIFDLNDLIGDNSDWSLLVDATGVNESGDIVGYGILNDGSVRGFVVEGFVPAPGTASLMALGGILATRRKR